MQTARSFWYSNLVQSFTSTIFPISTPNYLQRLFGMSNPPEGSVSQESIWGFDVSTVLGILNTPDLVVNHRRSADMQPLLPPVGICEKSVGGFTGVKCSIKDAKRGERGVK